MEEIKEQRNLAEISRDISNRLPDSIYVVEILDELECMGAKESAMLSKIGENIRNTFKDIERCRTIISIAE